MDNQPQKKSCPHENRETVWKWIMHFGEPEQDLNFEYCKDCGEITEHF